MKKSLGTYLLYLPTHAVIIIITLECNLFPFCVLDTPCRQDSITSWNTCVSLPVYTMNITRSFTPSSDLQLKKNEICTNSKRKYPTGTSAIVSQEGSVRDCARIRSVSSTFIKMNRRRKRKHPKKTYPVRSFNLSQKHFGAKDSTEDLNNFASCWAAMWRFCFKN